MLQLVEHPASRVIVWQIIAIKGKMLGYPDYLQKSDEDFNGLLASNIKAKCEIYEATPSELVDMLHRMTAET